MSLIKIVANGKCEIRGHIFDVAEAAPGENSRGEEAILLAFGMNESNCVNEVALTPAAALRLISDLAIACHKVGVARATNDELVAREDRCPNCGNRSKDELIWIENGVDGEVECGRCGHHYRITHA